MVKQNQVEKAVSLNNYLKMLSLLILEKFLPTLCKDDGNVIAFNNLEQLRLVKVDGHQQQILSKCV